MGQATHRKMEVCSSKYAGRRHTARHSHPFCLADDLTQKSKEMVSDIMEQSCSTLTEASDNFSSAFFVHSHILVCFTTNPTPLKKALGAEQRPWSQNMDLGVNPGPVN